MQQLKQFYRSNLAIYIFVKVKGKSKTESKRVTTCSKFKFSRSIFLYSNKGYRLEQGSATCGPRA